MKFTLIFCFKIGIIPTQSELNLHNLVSKCETTTALINNAFSQFQECGKGPFEMESILFLQKMRILVVFLLFTNTHKLKIKVFVLIIFVKV